MIRQHYCDRLSRVIPIDAAANTTYTKDVASLKSYDQGQYIIAWRITCETTEAANAVDFGTLTLQTSAGVTIGTVSNSATGFTANVPVDGSITAAAPLFKPGESLQVRKGVQGAGTLFGEILVEVFTDPVRE